MTHYNNFNITLRVFDVIAVVTVCLPCFGLSLDCSQRLSASSGLFPRRAWSPEWLCLYSLCFV